MIDLHIVDKEITTGSLAVTWCVDKDTLERIKTYEEPHLLIVSIPDPIESMSTKSENRCIVPFKDGMAYINFTRPGKHKIYTILFSDNLKTNKKYLLEKFGRSFSQNIFGFSDNDSYDLYSSNKLGYIESSIIEVDIPTECFAPEPSQWEKDWVLWLMSDKGVDQCAFRKRRLFAYTIQPVLLLIKLITTFLLTLLALLWGSRTFSLKFFLRPLYYEMPDIFDNTIEDPALFDNGTIFINKEKKRYWTMLFCPLIVVPIASGLIFLPLIKFLITISIFTVIIGVSFGIHFIPSIINYFSDKMAIIGGNNDLEDLLCTGEIKKPKHRSIKLRYLDLKSKVCKPFAR